MPGPKRDPDESSEEEEEEELSELRRVTVRTYKGATLIDFREHYRDKNTDEIKPGSKGLSLSLDQWEIVKAKTNLVDEMIARKTDD